MTVYIPPTIVFYGPLVLVVLLLLFGGRLGAARWTIIGVLLLFEAWYCGKAGGWLTWALAIAGGLSVLYTFDVIRKK